MKKMMNRLNNKKGFTLAELLIVVAIIGVLAAIAIPVFSSQLEKAKQATNIANIRSAYAQASVFALTGTAEATGGNVSVNSLWNASTINGPIYVNGVSTQATSKSFANYTDATWPEGVVPTGTPSKKTDATVTFTYTNGKLTAIAVN